MPEGSREPQKKGVFCQEMLAGTTGLEPATSCVTGNPGPDAEPEIQADADGWMEAWRTACS
jgi:hypothetical protein